MSLRALLIALLLLAPRCALAHPHVWVDAAAELLYDSKGRIAAIDTPEGLTARLQGAERVFLQVAHWSPDAAARLRAVDGVQEVQDRGDRGALVIAAAAVTDPAVVPAGDGLPAVSSRSSLPRPSGLAGHGSCTYTWARSS